MVPVETLSNLSFFQSLPAEVLRYFAENASKKEYQRQATIMHQHDIAESLYFLLSGTVKIFIRFEGSEDLYVGQLEEKGEIMGWSTFREPYRYTATLRCEKASNVLVLPRSALNKILKEDPESGHLILKKVMRSLANRLEQTRDILVSEPIKSGPGI